MKKPELLVPAGNLEKFKIAVLYGADAVFLGGYEYGLRSNSDNFSKEDIIEAAEFAKLYNVEIYVTTNIYAHQVNFDGYVEFIKFLEDVGIKGVIVSDPGYIELCRKYAPNLEIHISTQQSITNTKTVQFYENLNVDRVVLARELSFNEIKEISDNTNVEIEIFIHGAVCSSYSGRCTLSNHMTSRDSNRGGCSQSCRWDFQLKDHKKEDIINVELTDPETLFSMSAKDMNTIQHIPKLMELNIDSFKIEGRMKSYHYVATVTKVYRNAIDSYFENPAEYLVKKEWIDELKKAESREVFIGALDNDFSIDGQIYKEQYVNSTGYDYCGTVIDFIDNHIIIEHRNLFCIGDEIEILCHNQENIRFTIEKMYNQNDEEIMRANHPLMIVKIPFEKKIENYSMLRKINKEKLEKK